MSAATLAACDAAAGRARRALRELALATAEHQARLADLHRAHARLAGLREGSSPATRPTRPVHPVPDRPAVALPAGWGSLRSAWGREAERTLR